MQCFINGKKADFQTFEQRLKTLRHQFFGADVEQFDISRQERILDIPSLFGGQSRVDKSRRDAVGAQPFHLVFHQRNKRTDDDGHAFERDGGDLLTNAFAAAGGHEHERVAFVIDGLNDVGLQRPERVVAKVFFKRSRSVGEGHKAGHFRLANLKQFAFFSKVSFSSACFVKIYFFKKMLCF